MNGEASITIKEQDNAQVIPAEALVEEKYVWIKKDNTYQKREVTKGIESDTEFEITSGLSKSEIVVIAGFDQIGKRNLAQRIFNVFR